MPARKVIVAGALGVIGRAVLARFAESEAWEVVGLSRRSPDFSTPATCLALDLTDRDACAKALAPHRDASHIVFAALHEQPNLVRGWFERDQMDTNLAMLRNLFDAVESPALQHVTLLQGTKAYGAHLRRPVRLPAKEDEPRVAHDNFYFLQEDFLKERQVGRDWRWTILRPQVVLGVAIGSAMNVVAGVGAFAAIARDLGRPLDFPSHREALTEVTDARLLASAIEWAATTGACANETFNVANGDVLGWFELWPKVAKHFGMEVGEPSTIAMHEQMPGHAQRWDRMRERAGLAPLPLDVLMGSSWQYADVIWANDAPPGRPTLVSTLKARRFGFHDCVDSEEAFLERLGEMQDLGYLPR